MRVTSKCSCRLFLCLLSLSLAMLLGPPANGDTKTGNETTALAGSAASRLVLDVETKVHEIGNHILVLQDPSGTLNLAQVLAPENAVRFAQSTQDAPNFGLTNSAIFAGGGSAPSPGVNVRRNLTCLMSLYDSSPRPRQMPRGEKAFDLLLCDLSTSVLRFLSPPLVFVGAETSQSVIRCHGDHATSESSVIMTG